MFKGGAGNQCRSSLNRLLPCALVRPVWRALALSRCDEEAQTGRG